MLLNNKQKEIIKTTEGPLMVLAGAGSGKTRTIVMRIAHLIEDLDVSPYKILALTFSNKAAQEMRTRIALAISSNIKTLQVTTFHSFCARLLRQEAKYIGLSSNFVIYDDGDSRILIKNILARYGKSPKEVSPYEILNYICKDKDGSISKKDFQNMNDPVFFKQLYSEYERELLKSNAVDFGGLIFLTLELFKNFPKVLERYQKRYQYLIVDEYQDTNKVQFELVRLLSGVFHNICVVGDEDQSIYSWRGANIQNILDFEKNFQDAKVLKLEQNYRSSKNIIAAATAVIQNNQERKGKTLWTQNPNGDDIEIIANQSDKKEVEFIASEVKAIIKKGVSPLEIAVFYRANAQSRIIEDAFMQSNINYKVIGSVRFYSRKEIKDLIAYLRLVSNPNDSLALARVINTPTRGVGAVTLKKIEDVAISQNISLFDVFSLIAEEKNLNINIRITKKMLNAIKSFVSLIQESIFMLKEKESLFNIFEFLLCNSGYESWLHSQKTTESISRLENLKELSSSIKQFSTSTSETTDSDNLNAYLETVTLDQNQVDNEEDLQSDIQKRDQQFVSLMTIHSAKGLEFEYVFIVGVEENIFPNYRSINEASGVEEERRLFYVAMTRAMKKLYISFAESRYQFGLMKFNGPSRFIAEIPIDLCHNIKNKSKEFGSDFSDDSWDDESHCDNDYSSVNNQKCIKVSTRKSKYKKEQMVHHKIYGDGIIKDIFGSYSDEKVLIQFKDGSQKKFMAKFAPLSILK